MLLRFLTVHISSMVFGFCTSQDIEFTTQLPEAISHPPKSEPQKLLCRIKDDTENYFKEVPEMVRSKLLIPRIIPKNQTVPVTVEVVGEPEGRIFFQACQFAMLRGVPSKDCWPVNVVCSNETCSDYNITTSGQHHLGLHLPDHLSCKQCLLRVTHKSDHETRVAGTRDAFIVCGVFAVGSSRRKRQAESCQGFGEYIDLPGIDEWCRVNCAVGYCPSTHCTCANQAWPAEEEDVENEDEDVYVQFLS